MSLEFHRVNLDSNDKVGIRECLTNSLGDFHNNPCTIGQAPTVFIRPLVRCLGQELGEEITMGGMQLDTIIPGLLQVDGYMDKTADNILNLLLGSRVGFSKCAKFLHDELDIASRNRVGLQLLKCLTTRMADLTNDQTSMLLGGSGQLLECLKSFTSKWILKIDDHVSR